MVVVVEFDVVAVALFADWVLHVVDHVMVAMSAVVVEDSSCITVLEECVDRKNSFADFEGLVQLVESFNCSIPADDSSVG